MPGMLGDYTVAEIAAMLPDEIEAAQDRDFKKPTPQKSAGGFNLGTSVPKPDKAEDLPVPADDVWAKTKAKKGKPFVTPSGQRCLLRKLSVEGLLEAGILDQVTRLEGLAAELVSQSEGQPPEKVTLPGREEFAALLKVLNAIVPLAAEEPIVLPIPEDGSARVVGAIYPDDIELMDRVAIMNESLSKLKDLDSFRNAR